MTVPQTINPSVNTMEEVREQLDRLTGDQGVVSQVVQAVDQFPFELFGHSLPEAMRFLFDQIAANQSSIGTNTSDIADIQAELAFLTNGSPTYSNIGTSPASRVFDGSNVLLFSDIIDSIGAISTLNANVAMGPGATSGFGDIYFRLVFNTFQNLQFLSTLIYDLKQKDIVG